MFEHREPDEWPEEPPDEWDMPEWMDDVPLLSDDDFDFDLNNEEDDAPPAA